MPSTVSTAPAVLDELVALASLAVNGQENTTVFDGDYIREEQITHDVLLIGFDPNDDFVVTDTRTREQMSAAPDTERYAITCRSSSWRGSNVDAKVVRDRAYELVDLLAAEIARDQTLGGRVMSARVSSTNLGQAQTDKGAVATVEFTIAIFAHTG